MYTMKPEPKYKTAKRLYLSDRESAQHIKTSQLSNSRYEIGKYVSGVANKNDGSWRKDMVWFAPGDTPLYCLDLSFPFTFTYT